MADRGREVVTVEAVFGTVRCFENDLLTAQLREFGAHTRPELAFLLSVLEPGDRVFDLGAHVGTFSIPIARRVLPGGSLVAIEAHADYFRLLTHNLETNGLTGTVIPIHALLAPEGKRLIAAHDDRNSMATAFVNAAFWRRSSRLPYLSIDDLVDLHGAATAIKIDIEGLELDVLEASEFVRSACPVLYAEVSEPHLGRYGRTVEEFSEFLVALDYRLFRNVGPRNAAHDQFRVAEIPDLLIGDPFFDVLAIPRNSPRLTHVVPGSSNTRVPAPRRRDA